MVPRSLEQKGGEIRRNSPHGAGLDGQHAGCFVVTGFGLVARIALCQDLVVSWETTNLERTKRICGLRSENSIGGTS